MGEAAVLEQAQQGTWGKESDMSVGEERQEVGALSRTSKLGKAGYE